MMTVIIPPLFLLVAVHKRRTKFEVVGRGDAKSDKPCQRYGKNLDEQEAGCPKIRKKIWTSLGTSIKDGHFMYNFSVISYIFCTKPRSTFQISATKKVLKP